MRRLLKLIAYLTSFGVARGSLFLAPIVLGNLLSPRDYGTLEFAQAAAAIGAPLLAMGTAGVVPLVLVRNLASASWSAILLHHATGAALLISVALICLLTGLSTVVWLTALVTAVIVLQTLWSVALKSQGRGEASLFVDSGFWGVLTIAAMLATALAVSAADRWLWVVATVAAYAILLVSWTLWRLFKTKAAPNALRYSSTLQAGLPLMLASLMAVLATTSGRFGIGLLSTPEVVADYAILFRATALPIVIHQLIVVARYRQIFELSATALEQKLPVIVGSVLISVVAFWLLSGVGHHLLGNAFSSAFSRHRSEGLLILSQCVLWSAIALNDLVNARNQTAGAVVRVTAWYFVVVLPLTWFLLSGHVVTLSLFVPIHSFVMAGYFTVQIIVMRKNGIKLTMTWSLALFGFVALSTTSLLV